ncbi:MAG: threonine--tRNA ligase [Patescibacteria group bacterium]|nr:threonine--tRNA ligase [Patescibacteria group bacterium]
MSNKEKAVDLPAIEIQRHSCAHLLAAAVQELYPEAKFGVGPVVEHGFYYDLDLPKPLTPLDLQKLEKRMRDLQARKVEFVREEMPIEKAIELFDGLNQPYKVQLLRAIQEKGTTAVREEEAGDIDVAKPNVVSIYRTGKFTDLCRGPHVANAKEIGAFKLKSVAGAYWRGDENNPMLQRVYGLCFATQEELDAHLKLMEEAEKRDHRKLGQELDLYTFSNLVGPGLPMFTPRGTLVRRELETFVWGLQQPFGYQRVWIPHLAKTDLYKTSGHWDKFQDDLFHVTSKKTDDAFVIKPMNCPHHTQIFASQPRSYRDLPIRYSEVTTCYRDENTGQLQGLSRVRSLTQDDGHLFCRIDQVEQEVKNVYKIISKFYAVFKMSLRARLSTHDPEHPEKVLGSPEVWAKAEGTLAKILKEFKMDYTVGVGEAAFYGPKIDFMAKDAIGREWQLATVQLDFNLPERFQLEYTDTDGQKKRPVMIHRAILGSIERFMAVLIEHYAGAFPTWLAPVQVQVIPVGKDHWKVAKKLADQLVAAGIRAVSDDSRETVGYKIRKSEKAKVPYMLVVGDKEKTLKTVNVRKRGQQKETRMTVKAFVTKVTEEIAKRKG